MKCATEITPSASQTRILGDISNTKSSPMRAKKKMVIVEQNISGGQEQNVEHENL